MLRNRHFKPMLAIALALCAAAAPAATARPITTGPACSACEYGPLVDFARVHAPAGVAATVRLESPRGFDWGDAGIGGAAGVALHHSQSPGAYSCGINYHRNSVDGKYCPPRHATPIASLPPASAAPAKVIVRDSGFAWGDAAAGAGAMLVIVMLGAGAATAAIRRKRVPSRVSTTS